MILIKGSEANSDVILDDFRKKIGATWDGEELSKKTPDEYVRIISFKYFGGCYINVGEINWNEKICLRNHELIENGLLLRIMRTGIEGVVGSEKVTSANNIFMCNTNQKMDFILSKNVATQWIAVSFTNEIFKGLADEKDFKLKELIDTPEPWFNYFSFTPEIESHIRSIFEIRDNKTLRRSVFIAKIFEIFGLIRAQFEAIDFGVTTQKTNSEIEKMIVIKNELLSDYSSAPNVKELAARNNMSASTLQRSFKELFHEPILKFFNQNRLEEAHRQIKYTEQSVTEIGYSLGYSHVHHLSNAFKKQFGYSPNALRSKETWNPGL